ncbi:hypothetical protein SAMN06269250_1192 [Spirosoma fluviale]|uniref:Uncharacterized protein n=1 Tax=Spirosoma fluviale TaxID=1597977 RepID=A0A286F9U6_9BACT|nr:hypothetical protein SAMN06269250_1192 [Spirosoma fluviale]
MEFNYDHVKASLLDVKECSIVTVTFIPLFAFLTM